MPVLARLLGAEDALARQASLRVSPRQQAQYDELVASVRAALGPARGERLLAERGTLTLDQFVDTALAALESGVCPEPDAAVPASIQRARESGPLSPHEQEVLVLVAQGKLDGATAVALVISPNTVKLHVK
jgi:DNA-binding NarL/FixJ family response regulator